MHCLFLLPGGLSCGSNISKEKYFSQTYRIMIGRLPGLVLASPLAYPSVASFAPAKISLCLVFISGQPCPLNF